MVPKTHLLNSEDMQRLETFLSKKGLTHRTWISSKLVDAVRAVAHRDARYSVLLDFLFMISRKAESVEDEGDPILDELFS